MPMSFITTPDQEYLMSILGAVKAMRKTQAYRLLGKLDAGKTAQYVDRCLEQLRHMQKISLAGDMLMLLREYDAPPDKDMLAAIDIMLDLTDIRVRSISASTPPYKLCFLAEQKKGLGNYAVIAVPIGTERMVTAGLDSSGQDSRTITIIFLLSDLSQAGSVKTALPHFFALPDGGKYRYLSAET